jgi:hypothetical protein
LNGMSATAFNDNAAAQQAYLEAIADETSVGINSLSSASASDTASALNSISRMALRSSNTQVSFDVNLQTVVSHGGATNQIDTDITSFKNDLASKSSGGQLLTKMKEKSTDFNAVTIESPTFSASAITADSPAPTPSPTASVGTSSDGNGGGGGGGGGMIIYAGASGGVILALAIGIWYFFCRKRNIDKATSNPTVERGLAAAPSAPVIHDIFDTANEVVHVKAEFPEDVEA